MRLKSYFAGTVEAAMNVARQELGPDAMLVDSRRTNADSRHLGEYEVVCAVLPASAPESAARAELVPQAGSTPFQSAARASSLDRITQEVSELKQHMERMAATLARSSTGMANLRSNPQLIEAFSMLTAVGVEAMLAHDIIARAGERDGAEISFHNLVAAEVAKLLLTEARLGAEGAKQRIVALIGPPGSGKTTSLVKLAARYGLAARRPAQIISIDTYRVGAADQLRSYAAILGIGFQLVETPGALAQALEEYRQKDLIFIDTPGLAKADIEEGSATANILSRRTDIEKHLVLPISMKDSDMQRVAAQFEAYRPNKLLFTRLDETDSFGGILNQVVRSGKPVSFLTAGQQIPEDLEPASKPALLKLILAKQWAENAAGATAAA